MKTVFTELGSRSSFTVPHCSLGKTKQKVERCSSCASSSTEHKGILCVCCAAIALTLANSQESNSQEFGHTDVLFEYGPEKIEINAKTFTSFFPTQGIARQFQTLPRFASETDAGFGILPNDELTYNVLSGLEFWVDGKSRPSLVGDTQIRVRNRPSHTSETIVTPTTTDLRGNLNPPRNRIGRASSIGDFHSDLQWFLESNDEDSEPPNGTYAIRLNLTTNRPNIGDSDPFYFIWHFGANTDDFNDAVAYFENRLSTPSHHGDFNRNGQLDANDAETLVNAIRDGSSNNGFDLDADGSVNFTDLEHWVSQIALTWHGDVNLDGEFSSSDLVSVFAEGRYESLSEASWRQGDWNADGHFGSADLIVAFQDGGYEQGRRGEAIQTVPESFGLEGLAVWLLSCMAIKQDRNRRTRT